MFHWNSFSFLWTVFDANSICFFLEKVFCKYRPSWYLGFLMDEFKTSRPRPSGSWEIRPIWWKSYFRVRLCPFIKQRGNDVPIMKVSIVYYWSYFGVFTDNLRENSPLLPKNCFKKLLFKGQIYHMLCSTVTESLVWSAYWLLQRAQFIHQSPHYPVLCVDLQQEHAIR